MTRAMPAMWLDLLSMYPYPSKCILNHWSGFNMASRRWRPWLLPSPSSASWKWKKSQETLRRFVHQSPAPFFPQWMKGLSERNERRHFLWAQLRCHTQVAWRWSPLLPKRRSSSPKQPSSQKRARARAPFRWMSFGDFLLECFWRFSTVHNFVWLIPHPRVILMATWSNWS